MTLIDKTPTGVRASRRAERVELVELEQPIVEVVDVGQVSTASDPDWATDPVDRLLAESEPAPEHSRFKDFFRSLATGFAMFRNTKSMIGLCIMAVFLLTAIFAPLIARYEPHAQDWTQLRSAPSWRHWFGTTHMGEDVWAQIIWGTRNVMLVGIIAAIIATFVAAAMGVLSGYLRGWWAEALSAITNVFLVLPALALIIIITAQMENPSIALIAAVQASMAWAAGARVIRAQTLSLRNREFIQAAQANGEPLWRIICVEMLPNLMALMAGTFSMSFMGGVMGITALSFIGILPVTTLNWGTVLFWAQQNGAFPHNWWWFVPAGALLALMGTALSLIQFGIDEYVNPRLRSAGERRRALKKRGIKLKDGATAVVSLDDNPDLDLVKQAA